MTRQFFIVKVSYYDYVILIISASSARAIKAVAGMVGGSATIFLALQRQQYDLYDIL